MSNDKKCWIQVYRVDNPYRIYHLVFAESDSAALEHLGIVSREYRAFPITTRGFAELIGPAYIVYDPEVECVTGPIVIMHDGRIIEIHG